MTAFNFSERLNPLRHPLVLLSLALWPLATAEAAVSDWGLGKGPHYRQTSDDTAPTSPEGWLCGVWVSATDGDAASVTISGGGLGGTLPLDDTGGGYWQLTEFFASEAEMNAAFPSSTTYTITLSGGTLGTLVQTVTLGSAAYPDTPYFTGSDSSRLLSVDSTAPFDLHWGSRGNANNIFLELSEFGSGNFVADAEFPGGTGSMTIPADTMAPGHGYEAYIEYNNRTAVSGAGGFGATGYASHSRFLQFNAFAVLSPHVAPIVGAWQFGDGAADASGVLVFQANGTYFLAEDATGSANDGMERGTYSWNEGTGVLTATQDTDTNGESGLSNAPGVPTVVVDGGTLTISSAGNALSLTRVSATASPIVGGWRICDNANNNTGILVLLSNGIYFHAEVNDGDPTGADGIERGTYVWNPGSGALTVTPIVDTNGTLGGSDPVPGPDFTASVIGTKVLMIADIDSTALYRISNAAVMADWRLNKETQYLQVADNTPPAGPDHWGIWSRVETRNPGDATSVTISGGGISGNLAYTQTGTAWTMQQSYASEALLDGEFPSSTTYTITVSGGELGTLTQPLHMGTKAYPNAPYLTGTVLSDALQIDPTVDHPLAWNDPGPLTASQGSTHLEIWKLVEGEPVQLYDWNESGAHLGHAVPAQTLEPGQQYFGYLEFGKTDILSGAGGFGIFGSSNHLSELEVFSMNTLSPTGLVTGFANDSGLTGDDALPMATPYGDGVPNLLKYAFNMNAGAPDTSTLTSGSGSSGLPAFAMDDSGPEPVFRVEFVRRKGSGLVYTAKHSSNLASGSFTPMSGAVNVTNIDAQFERVTVEEPCDPAVTPRCFGIVEVVAP